MYAATVHVHTDSEILGDSGACGNLLERILQRFVGHQNTVVSRRTPSTMIEVFDEYHARITPAAHESIQLTDYAASYVCDKRFDFNRTPI